MRIAKAVKPAKRAEFSTVFFDVGRAHTPQMVPLRTIYNKRRKEVAIHYGPANAINVRRHLEVMGFPSVKVRKALKGQFDVVVKNRLVRQTRRPNDTTLQLNKIVITSESGQFLGRGKVLVEREGDRGNLNDRTARVIRSSFELPPKALKKRMKKRK